MPKLAANLSMMFNEVAFLDRFDAAAKAGFTAVEFLFPYDFPAIDLKRRLDANGLTQALFNMPPGDWANGERGLASLPGRQQEFRDSVKKALEYADILDSKLIHCMAGIPPAGTNPVTAAALYASNLAWAGEHAKAAGRRLALEPINHRDMPGFHLNTVEQGAAVVDAIGIDRVGLQFDIYHTQISQGDVTRRMEAQITRIVHMQIADVPARNEPGTGEIGWPYVFRRIDELGYQGWIGCEYRPAGDTVAGLAWRKQFGV